MGSARDHTPADPRRAEVRARIARAHGHLHGILDMIDEDRAYEEILQQIGAVRAALDKATAVILDDLITSAQEAPKPKQKEKLEAVRVAIKKMA